ncbi:MAG TPA: hypothetical protein PLU35_04715 [Phycisphaerales bacterium]|nr:hypothetical protein [Phycisphaerales bacterium]
MMPRGRLIAGVVGLALASWVGYAGYGRLYAKPAAERLARLDSFEKSSRWLEDQMEDEFRVRERLVERASATLGASAEVVEHRFRTGLSAIAASAGLRDVVVTQNRPVAESNPAARERVRDFTRDQLRVADFYTVAGELRAKGTLEQVTRAIALAQAQPWVARVGSLTIRPESEDRQQFELRLSVQTVVLPDVAKDSETTPPVIVEPAEEAQRFAASVAARNAFAPPKPEPPPRQPRQEQRQADRPPPPPPPPPYDLWRLNAVVSAGGQVEAWLVNLKSGEWRSLRPGDGVLDAVLVEAGGEKAVFRIGEQAFQVLLNETLAQRQPVQ